MWTKGMIMVVCGISGLIITFLWIIILCIVSAVKRQKRQPDRIAKAKIEKIGTHIGANDFSKDMKQTVYLKNRGNEELLK